MTMMKKGSPFPRLPIAKSKSGEALAVTPGGHVTARPPEPLMHAARPVDYVKQPPRPSFPRPKPTVAQPVHAFRSQAHKAPPARYIPVPPAGQKPVRPPSTCYVPPKPVLPKPAFLTRPSGGSSERQTGGFGSLSSVEHPTPVTVRAPAASAPGPYKGYKGRMDRIDPDEIPF